MNCTRLVRGLSYIVILICMAGTIVGQEVAPDSGVLESNRAEFFAKFAVADYEAQLPDNPEDLAVRKAKSQRYDNQHWVVKNPSPDTDYARRRIAVQPLPTFPIEESDIVVIGLAIGVTAHLSNDKSGIYSEYTVRVEQVMKDSTSRNLGQGSTITIDRAGGAVRYPDGRKLAYFIAEKKLPTVGSTYALFLKDDRRSKNYEIVTLYEFKRESVVALDTGYSVDEIRGMTKSDFVKALQEKLARRSDD